MCVRGKSLQSCVTLCDSVHCSPPGSSVHEILQARILGWVVIPFSRRSCGPRDQTQDSSLQADSLQSKPPGNLKLETCNIATLKLEYTYFTTSFTISERLTCLDVFLDQKYNKE